MMIQGSRSVFAALALSFALSLGLARGVEAQPTPGAPALIPLQGVLTDAAGAPVDGDTLLHFTLYDGEAGASVFTEDQLLPLQAGHFSTHLGAAITLDLSLFSTLPEVWLGISVDGFAELPRMRLATAPYAALAHQALSATLADRATLADSAMSIDNGALYSIDGQPNVGLGTTTPSERLMIAGNIGFVRGADAFVGFRPANTGGNSLTVQAGGSASSWAAAVGGGNLILRAGNANVSSSVAGCPDGGSTQNNNVMIYAGDNVFGGICSTQKNGDIVFFGGDGQPERMRLVGNTGQVGIGTSTPGYTLHVNGSVAGTSAYANLSDGRYKTHVRELSDALERVMRLRAVSYDWKRDEHPELALDERRQVGFIAQEVKEIVPEAVSQSGDGVYAIAYGSLVPVVVKAMQEQQASLDEVRERERLLKARVERLEQRLGGARVEQSLLPGGSEAWLIGLLGLGLGLSLRRRAR